MPLTPRAFDVLRYLVERADRLVTPEEILEALWPETYVNPEGIRKYILEIRKVLGDRLSEPLFIQTFPKRGYQFIAKVTDERRLPPRATACGNMVGRGAALAQLHDSFEKASAGQRQVVFVSGEAGIGKTTLVDMFQQAAGHRDPRIARGQCIEGFGGKEAYYPMLDALGSLFLDAKHGSLVHTLAKHAPTWLAQFPSLVKPEQRDWLQREVLRSTHGRMVREICEALEAMAAHGPWIVILEDLHWVDASTLDLISAFARRREPARVLLICTYRSADAAFSQSPLKTLKQDLLVHHLCHEITIDRLNEPDIAEYLTKAFPDNLFPSCFAQLIYDNSDGNPLFMAAVIRDIVNRGLIARDEGRWRVAAPCREICPGIPETLQGMLEIQFQHLSAEEQRILQSGSIAGERFSSLAAASMLNLSPASIEEVCDRLANRQQFIRSIGILRTPNGVPSAHYEFTHSLYHQAFHRSLSGLDRSSLHRRSRIDHPVPVPREA
ncbi:MAG: AAA family ATPase [Acidobacteria bacterium]|nr:AAA family ATPase [Acidobacteriota bacterium]